MTQRLSRSGAAFVRALEGVVLHAYLDSANILTIGIGFTWQSVAFRKWWGKHRTGPFDKSSRMTRTECDEVLQLIFDEEYGKAVAAFFGKQVAQHIFDGTSSPVFNMGPGALNWNWAKAVKAGDLVAAGAYLRKTGVTAKGTGKILKGLQSRRKEEDELLRTGDYTIGGTLIADPMADGMLVHGERGAAVTALQTDLTTLGFYKQTIDQIFGHGTKAAVIEFQRARGLETDGFAGPETLKAIQKAIAARKPQDAPPHPGAPEPAPTTSTAPIKSIAAVLVLAIGAGWAWLSALPCDWLSLFCK